MAEFFFGKLAGVCGLADNSGALVDFSRRLLEHRADLGQFGNSHDLPDAPEGLFEIEIRGDLIYIVAHAVVCQPGE